ncbi:6-carboxytetrahydropterin synthase QueD [Micromonospora sp. DH14]|uniref:6-carboxytetrahydropterin synthase QueD n=1 Tax=Micromonospora sp. DH14 TaxID=3040120 RepID=UPI002442D2D6|nr:6-carboxytetrahydropterin synthase QueD [Micromonospora sp. DH14]MDG9674798.1 6-carboxytetrahydropterin synthase QueD [Micromonospora sp. DH14]
MIGVWRIGKRFSFDASHQLPGLPEGHKCGRLHGHTYTVEVVLEGDSLTGPGFVTDFGDLAPFGRYINDHLDHRHLNDVLGDVAPTSERLAWHLAQWLKDHLAESLGGRLAVVRVSETPSSWAEYVLDVT